MPAETDRFRLVVAALEDGKEIPLHAPGVDLVMAVMDGTGEVVAGATAPRLQSGPPSPGRARSDELLTHADRMEAGSERLRAAASGATGASPPRLASIVQSALDFLVHETIPRLVAEREVLYPVLERVLRRPEATAALEVEQAEIRTQTERLGALAQCLGDRPVGRPERRALERILTDLSCLLLGHGERVTSLGAEARAAESGLDAGWDALERVLEEAERRVLDSVVLVVQPEVSSQAAVVMRHDPAANRAYAITLGDLARDREMPKS